MIDWCKSLGFDCLQLLPLNDTGFDPSPYNPLSSSALDPIYLSLWDLPDGVGGLDRFAPYRETPRLFRKEVKTLKLEWLRAYFDKTFAAISQNPSYQEFLSTHWLVRYSCFMANKTTFDWKPWKEWPLDFKEDPREIDFYNFLQYLCFSQFEKVRGYASERSFFLVGDMPYLLSPDSADVWVHRTLFHLNLSAGTPPDKYNFEGQDWGFPLFDWNAMEKDDYSWWNEKFSILPKLYHIYRIDHIIGFFRIWAIAEGQKPVEGHYIPTTAAEWTSQGRKILEMMIDFCPLLPIGEDLGSVPEMVRPLLKELGICSTKVFRWEETTPYDQYEPLSLTTLSTPDMEPVPLWWQKYPTDAASFSEFKNWQYEPTLSPEREFEILRDSHHTASYFHINLLQEYLFPFPELHSPNLEEERINVPGTLLPTNWTYRFRPSIEEITSHEALAQMVRDILKS